MGWFSVAPRPAFPFRRTGGAGPPALAGTPPGAAESRPPRPLQAPAPRAYGMNPGTLQLPAGWPQSPIPAWRHPCSPSPHSHPSSPGAAERACPATHASAPAQSAAAQSAAEPSSAVQPRPRGHACLTAIPVSNSASNFLHEHGMEYNILVVTNNTHLISFF